MMRTGSEGNEGEGDEDSRIDTWRTVGKDQFLIVDSLETSGPTTRTTGLP